MNFTVRELSNTLDMNDGTIRKMMYEYKCPIVGQLGKEYTFLVSNEVYEDIKSRRRGHWSERNPITMDTVNSPVNMELLTPLVGRNVLFTDRKGNRRSGILRSVLVTCAQVLADDTGEIYFGLPASMNIRKNPYYANQKYSF